MGWDSPRIAEYVRLRAMAENQGKVDAESGRSRSGPFTGNYEVNTILKGSYNRGYDKGIESTSPYSDYVLSGLNYSACDHKVIDSNYSASGFELLYIGLAVLAFIASGVVIFTSSADILAYGLLAFAVCHQIILFFMKLIWKALLLIKRNVLPSILVAATPIYFSLMRYLGYMIGSILVWRKR